MTTLRSYENGVILHELNEEDWEYSLLGTYHHGEFRDWGARKSFKFFIPRWIRDAVRNGRAVIVRKVETDGERVYYRGETIPAAWKYVPCANYGAKILHDEESWWTDKCYRALYANGECLGKEREPYGGWGHERAYDRESERYPLPKPERKTLYDNVRFAGGDIVADRVRCDVYEIREPIVKTLRVERAEREAEVISSVAAALKAKEDGYAGRGFSIEPRDETSFFAAEESGDGFLVRLVPDGRTYPEAVDALNADVEYVPKKPDHDPSPHLIAAQLNDEGGLEFHD